jgi:hypothetical protein
MKFCRRSPRAATGRFNVVRSTFPSYITRDEATSANTYFFPVLRIQTAVSNATYSRRGSTVGFLEGFIPGEIDLGF